MFALILGKIFKHDNFYYTPRPHHQVISLLLMGIGTVTAIRDGWSAFGACVFCLGFFTGIWIIWGGIVEKYIHYWTSVDDAAKTLSKISDPDILQMMGFKVPAKEVRVIEDMNAGQGFVRTQYHDLPVSSAVMQVIADSVLSGHPFSEGEMVKRRKIITSPKFRQLQKDLKDRGYIKPHNSRDNRQGFALTRKGANVMYGFASPSVKKLTEQSE